jgi:hypothetical protein
MSHGKYLSLEEARKYGTLSRFAKEHPSEGDGALFDRLLDAMLKSQPEDDQTSTPATSEDCNETQTRRDT